MIFRMVRLSGPHDIQNGKVVPEIIQEGHELFFVEVFTMVKSVTMSQSLFFRLTVQKLALGVVDGGVDSVFVQSQLVLVFIMVEA